MEESNGMKTVFSILTWLAFLYAMDTVGAIEQEMVPFGIGVVKAFLGVGAFGLFSELAGLTYPRKRKSRPRSCSPKGGKRKCSNTL